MAGEELGEGLNPTPEPPERIAARELVERSEAVLERVGEALGVDDVSLVLPGAHEKRDEATGDLIGRELTDDERQVLIDSATEFGFARVKDLKPSDVGLPHGYVAAIEGGQLHKVASEITAAFDPDAMPGKIFVMGSKREVTADTERAMSAGLCGIDEMELGETEFEIVGQFAKTLPGFEIDEEKLPYRYDIHNNNVISRIKEEVEGGQFTRIGRIGETEIIHTLIDREDYFDEEKGEQKYRKQPNSGQALKIIDDVLTAQGDTDTPVGLGSSGTYALTRALRVVRQSLDSPRAYKFFAYGTETIGAVRKQVDPEDNWAAPVKQVPEELGGMYKEVQLLKKALNR